MRHGEYKEINGYIVQKGTTTQITTRDGYAKACYRIYENIDDMHAFKPIGHCYTMKEAKDLTKDL